MRILLCRRGGRIEGDFVSPSTLDLPLRILSLLKTFLITFAWDGRLVGEEEPPSPLAKLLRILSLLKTFLITVAWDGRLVGEEEPSSALAKRWSRSNTAPPWVLPSLVGGDETSNGATYGLYKQP
jgi:hypothetical protein